MTTPVVPVRKFVADAAERVGWTFVETFAGAIAVAAVAGRLDLPVIYAAAIAAAAAALTVVKALAAARLGTTGTAATLPADLTPMAPAPPTRPPDNLPGQPSPALVKMFTPAPTEPVTEPTPIPVELAPDYRPPVEALGHVDPPDVPPPPSAAAKARQARAQAAQQAKTAKAVPAKKSAAKKASGTRKRSR